MIYLASPYSHEQKFIRYRRFQLAEQCTAALMLRGLSVFSPIVHCHRIAIKYDMPKDAAYWWNYNKSFLLRASECYILKIDGWQESAGVQQEIGFAYRHSFPITFIAPDGTLLHKIDPIQVPTDENN